MQQPSLVYKYVGTEFKTRPLKSMKQVLQS